MDNIQNIKTLLSNAKISLSGNIIENPSAISGYFIPIERLKLASGISFPSGKLLSEVRERIKELGYIVDFIINDVEKKEIEDSLRGSLINSFPDFARNCFLSLDDDSPKVWIDTKKTLDTDTVERLESHLAKFAEVFSLSKIVLVNSEKYHLATQFEILSVVRRIAPSRCEEIEVALRKGGFSVPSTSWVNHRLDVLRRVGSVIRLKNGAYAVTLQALHGLGTVKSRNSPDIKRLLELARRRR